MGKGVAVKEDKMSMVLSFEDGSIGTVNYFGNGSKSYPKGNALKSFRKDEFFAWIILKNLKDTASKDSENSEP